MSVAPESGGFDDIVNGLTLTEPLLAPMDGEWVLIDEFMGEEARRQLLAICEEISGKMAVKGKGFTEKQVDHADRVLRKRMDKAELPFTPDELLALGGAGVVLVIDKDEEVEIDIQVEVINFSRRLFGRFVEAQYNQYPVKEGIAELPEDYEGRVLIDGDEEGYVVYLSDVIICEAEEAGFKVDSYEAALIPIAPNDLRFHTVYKHL